MTAHSGLLHAELERVTAAAGQEGRGYPQVAVLDLNPLQSPKAALAKRPLTGRVAAVTTYEQIGDYLVVLIRDCTVVAERAQCWQSHGAPQTAQ